MVRNSPIAIAVVHQSGEDLLHFDKIKVHTLGFWRIKNWKRNPVDPGWEDGRYCWCHPYFRNAKSREVGEVVVDCVKGWHGGEGYIVRSFFQIEKVERCQFGLGKDLLFSSYFFCDGETPFRFRRWVGPKGTYLTNTELYSLETHTGYHSYQVSLTEGPISIAQEDWNAMVKAKFHDQRLQEEDGTGTVSALSR
jgi:hypothetical protein